MHMSFCLCAVYNHGYIIPLVDKGDLVYSSYSGSYVTKKKEDENRKKDEEEKSKSKEILKNMEKTKTKIDYKGRSKEKDKPVAATSKGKWFRFSHHVFKNE